MSSSTIIANATAAAAAVAKTLSSSPPTVLVVATAAAGACALAGFGIAHMLYLERYTDWLYYDLKLIKRRQPLGKVDKQERNLWENFSDLALLTFPPLLILAPTAVKAITTGTIDFSFKPLHILASNLLIYIGFDSIYYFVHRSYHEIPFLYRTIHKRHHETLPVHVFVTAKAYYLENLLAVTPGLICWVLATNALLTKGTFNFWTYIIPALTLIMEFNTGHSGYLDHWTLYVTSPLQYTIKMLPFARTLSAEHEIHHISVNKNYAPVFRLFDILGGSHESPAAEKYETADVVEPRFKPRASAPKEKSN
ncbi:hypothetical protein DFJ73DRAFT_764427 [Zopfochytrium polystomum]|nr:hypothetical protein DFJ73DRAFT_764427 [Zopfochytrium polystomum]